MGRKVFGPHEDLTYRIIGVAKKVHRSLGPGHKESVYQQAMEIQSVEDDLCFDAEKPLEVYDRDALVGFYIPDFIYEAKVVVELKAFSSLSRKYLGQVITYLNHTGLSVGLLLNFGERDLRIRRVFPSPAATEFRIEYQWMFVPDWLKADRAAMASVSGGPARPLSPGVTSVSPGNSVSGGPARPFSPGVASVSPGNSVSGGPARPLSPGVTSVSPGNSVSGELVDRLLASLVFSGPATDVRIGTHWTAVVADTARGSRAGIAATQLVHDLEHGRPAVRDAGKLTGKDARELAALAKADSLTERSVGFAAINALLEVDFSRCSDRNAEDLILERGRGRNVAVVGHFPFVPRVREAAAACWVLELNPGPGDLPAVQAPEVIPQADVVAITAMTLVNGTFDALVKLARRGAFVVLLGPSTPLVPLLFDYGVDAISGSVIQDIPAALLAISQGANFRQIPGKRLLTMLR